MNERNPRDLPCPAGHEAPECPLFGGTMPPLEWGPPVGVSSDAEQLDTERGPETSEHRFGTCVLCRSTLMTDHEGVGVLTVEPNSD